MFFIKSSSVSINNLSFKGNLLWKYKTNGSVLASPAFVDDTLYVPSTDGFMYALKGSNGTLLWKFGVGTSINSSPVVNNGIVYFGAENGKIYAIK